MTGLPVAVIGAGPQGLAAVSQVAGGLCGLFRWRKTERLHGLDVGAQSKS